MLEAGTSNLVYATAHFLDPQYKGCVLEEYAGAYEAAKQELRRIAAKYDEPTLVSEENPSEVEAEEDAHLTAVERLNRSKRRRISGDSEDGSGFMSVPVLSKRDLEIQGYEKCQVYEVVNILKWWKDHEQQLPLLAIRWLERSSASQPPAPAVREPSVLEV